MKTHCDACDGEGAIYETCWECDGKGTVDDDEGVEQRVSRAELEAAGQQRLPETEQHSA